MALERTSGRSARSYTNSPIDPYAIKRGRTRGGSARHKPYKGACFCQPHHPAWVSCEKWSETYRLVLKADGITPPKGTPK